MIPKLPLVPLDSIVQIKTKAMIQAENDARIAVARKAAHKVSASEQLTREGNAKKVAAKQRKVDRMAVEVLAKPQELSAPKEEKTITMVFTSWDGSTILARALTASAALIMVTDTLLTDSKTNRVTFQDGVILTLWKGGKATRKWYAEEDRAHGTGRAALAEEKAESFTVSDTVRRVDVLAGERELPRDQVIPSRKQGAICTSKNYNRETRWQKASGDTNVRSNMGPSGYSLGWNAR